MQMQPLRSPIRVVPIVMATMLVSLATAVGGDSVYATAADRTFRLAEKLPPGTQVGNIRDTLKQSLQPDELANITVRLYLPDDPVSRLFRVSPDGSVLTRERIDRDTLCDSRSLCCDKDMRQSPSPGPVEAALPYCLLKFDASVTTVVNRRFLMPTVSVQLVDLNDNKPTFHRSKYIVHFKETDRVGASVPLPMARDADWGRNGVVDYRLSEEPSASTTTSALREFELRVLRHEAIPSDDAFAVKGLELVNRRPLDREARSWYGVSLVAEDGAGNVGRTFLNVTIDDVNDCSPEFLNGSRQTVEVSEDARPHSVVFSVLAVDRDEGQNGRVVYGLRPGRRRPYPAGQFSVDPYTGRVSLNSRLAFKNDEDNSYELYVTAYDSGVPRRSSEIEIEVRIIDVNDHSPSIRVQGVNEHPGSSAVSIRENVHYTPQIVIATLLASDADSGENGRVQCKMSSSGGDKFGLQFVKQMGGNRAFVHSLFALGSFDRERQASHSLVVECWDHGANPMRSEAIVRVLVEDVNDSPPVWRQTDYVFSVRENQRSGATIGRVRAEDADAPPNDAIRYRLVEEQPEISVEAATGQLLSGRPFDREARDRYAFQVVAVNTEEPYFSATAQVTLVVLDENDNSPVFADSTPSRILVMEDAPLMTLITVVNVTDADEAGNRRFKFSVANDGSGRASKFSVNDRGELTLVGSLDREVDSEHRLLITVTDNGTPSRTSVFRMTVQVGDVNDTPPTFIFPDGQRGSSQVNISNSLPPGGLVAKVIARDDDEGPNGNLTYHLLPEAPIGESDKEARGYFQLDPITGYLRVQTSLRALTSERLFPLRVQASDGGGLERQHKRDAILRVLVKPDPGGPGGGGGRRTGGGGAGGGGARQAASDAHPMLLIVLLAAGLAVLLLVVLFLLAVFAVLRRRGAGAGGVDAPPEEPNDCQRTYGSLPGKVRTHQQLPSEQFIPLAGTKNRRAKASERRDDTDCAERMLAADREFGHQQSSLAFGTLPGSHSEADLAAACYHEQQTYDVSRWQQRARRQDDSRSSTLDSRRAGGGGCVGDYSVPGPASPMPHQRPQRVGGGDGGGCFDVGQQRPAAVTYTRLRRTAAEVPPALPAAGIPAVVAALPSKRLRTPYDNVSDV